MRIAGPGFWANGGLRASGHFVQVIEYLLDDDWVIDGGDDLGFPAADATGFDVDLEHPLQSLRPSHGRPALTRCRRLGFTCTMHFVAPAPPGRGASAEQMRDQAVDRLEKRIQEVKWFHGPFPCSC